MTTNTPAPKFDLDTWAHKEAFKKYSINFKSRLKQCLKIGYELGTKHTQSDLITKVQAFRDAFKEWSDNSNLCLSHDCIETAGELIEALDKLDAAQKEQSK